MKVIVANCRYEGTKILLPFLLNNLARDGVFKKSFIWEGQVDTGFDGYLMMPFKSVQQNGLQLMEGFGSWTLADGSNTQTINTLGEATIVGRSAFCVVASPTSGTDCGILIGQKMLEMWSVMLESDPVNKVAQLIGLPPKQS